MLHQGLISIVDDDDSVRSATSKLLRQAGYPVESFASGEDYLCSAAVDDTRCLISDVRMAGMSGLDLQAHLIEKGYRIPIIFMTAYPEDKVRARAMAAGAVCFISKPFDAEVLTGFIEQALATPP
ncbi:MULTISPECIES: response regulator [unclassified Mesorhizobium]|uniref:response regulator transcription factor n=1 Tax=unclassified Mesorhizobium TaxID=325217 RepID=UPI00047BBC07